MVGFLISLHKTNGWFPNISPYSKSPTKGLHLRRPKKNQRPLLAQARKDAIKPALAFFTGLGGRNLVGPGGPGGE